MDKTEHQEMAEREHPGSGAKYVYALIALLCLTALTFGLHYVTVGELGMAVALTIAAAKVGVVALVFMELGELGELRESMAATRAVAAVAVVFVVLLCLGVFADVGFR
jgi:caa(3)-type oxidase subunit IV